MNPLHASAQKVQELLKSNNITTRVVEFSELTRSAQEAAQAIGCTVGQIAKTIIFKTKESGQPICVIASGMNRVDEKKIEALVGKKIEKPDAEFVLTHTGYPIGGVSPVGLPFHIKPFIDQDLQLYTQLWAAAGTPHAVFAITLADLVRITQATLVDVKKG